MKRKAPTRGRGQKQSKAKHNKNKVASKSAPPLSTRSQRYVLLQAIRKAGSKGVTTRQARAHLDIMSVAARIHELRHDHNHNIKNVTGTHEEKGTEARYVLFPGNFNGGAL